MFNRYRRFSTGVPGRVRSTSWHDLTSLPDGSSSPGCRVTLPTPGTCHFAPTPVQGTASRTAAPLSPRRWHRVGSLVKRRSSRGEGSCRGPLCRVFDVARVRGLACPHQLFLVELGGPLLGQGLLSFVPPAPGHPRLLRGASGQGEAPLRVLPALPGEPLEHAVGAAGGHYPGHRTVPVKVLEGRVVDGALHRLRGAVTRAPSSGSKAIRWLVVTILRFGVTSQRRAEGSRMVMREMLP